MSKKCFGCGSILQNVDMASDGYILDINMDYCLRCFKLRNYNVYNSSVKNNKDYMEILNRISQTNALVVWVASVFNMDLLKNMNDIIKNDILLVINKRDILPKSVKDFKIINYLKKLKINYLDLVVVSSINNYQMDQLYAKINKYKRGKEVYVVGYTNSGKSTLVNKIIKNYSDNCVDITSSIYPSTTLDEIPIRINNELTIIDTPGLVSEGSIINSIGIDKLRLINISNEMRPRTYQLNGPVSFIIDNMVRIDYLSNRKNSMTIYLSNKLKIIKCGLVNSRLHDLEVRELKLGNNMDIVVEDLCFIKMVNACDINIYINSQVNTFIRENLI